MSSPGRLNVILILFALLVLMHVAPQSTKADTDFPWSKPELLVGIPKGDESTLPFVFTGESGKTFLLFFSRPSSDPEGPFTLYIAEWLGDRWSTLNDVLVSPEPNIPRFVTAVEDREGYLQVFWTGTNLWTSSAPTVSASDVSAWSLPAVLFDAAPVLTTEATVDTENNIYVAVTTSDQGVVVVRDSPGDAVEQVTTVRELDDDRFFPDRVSIVATDSDVLIICWFEIDTGESGRSRGGYCSRSIDKGASWEPAQQVAEDHRGIRVFYHSAGNLLSRIVWGGIGVGGREIQFSSDDGNTWSTLIDLTQGESMEGFTGQVALMDSLTRVHVLVNRGDGHYFHSFRQDVGWSPAFGSEWIAFDWINAAVAGGNTIVATYWDDEGIWVTEKQLDAPEIVPMVNANEVVELDANPVQQIEIEMSAISVDPTPSSTETPGYSQEAMKQVSVGTPIILGVIPVILGIFAMALMRSVKSARR